MISNHDVGTPKPLGHNLTEPIYNAILKALDEDPAKLDLLLSLLHPSDIADLLERLPQRGRIEVIHRVSPESLGDVIANVSTGVQETLLEELSEEEMSHALSSLESDDVADLVQQMSDEQVVETLRLIPEIQQALLNYPEDSAGGIMQLEVLAVPQSWTIERLLNHLQNLGEDAPERLTTVCVTDHTRKLLGTISLSRLVRLKPSSKLGDIMRQDPITVSPELSQREVAKIFEKYDLINCPVVDRNTRLLGQITIDDVMDVMMEEHEREIMQRAGLSEGEDLFAPALSTTQRRLPWLLVNLVTAIMASLVITMFEGTIQRLVILAVLMPIVASMGGNAGTQTLTVTVRGLSLNQITVKNALILLRKELLVGTFNGMILGILLAAGTVVVYGDKMLGVVILAATVLNHIFAAIAGNAIPVLLKRAGADPAISSGVLVTTVTDVMGFFIFLGLAALLLL